MTNIRHWMTLVEAIVHPLSFIGAYPHLKENKSTTPRLGTNYPTGKVPQVNWSKKDIHDSSYSVSRKTILFDYVPEKDKNKVTIYHSYIPVNEMPEQHFGNEEEDYHWESFGHNNPAGFPPIKLIRLSNDRLIISDGNHRAYYWIKSGYNFIPAWVIDYKPRPRLREATNANGEPMKRFPGLTPGFLKKLRTARHEERICNGGGGSCHLVSEWIEAEYGWTRVSGTYTTADYKEPIVPGHYWNLLPNGSILDATADQLGEGHDVRIVPKISPEYHRYRPEFGESLMNNGPK